MLIGGRRVKTNRKNVSLSQEFAVNMLNGNPVRLISVMQCPDFLPFMFLDSTLRCEFRKLSPIIQFWPERPPQFQ